MHANYANPDAKLKEANKLRKKASSALPDDVVHAAVEFLRSEGVECIGAPFEADWQLASSERCGYTQLTMTEDSDLFPLGSGTPLSNINMPAATFHVTRHTDGIAALRESAGCPNVSEANVLEFCVFLGTDYVPRLTGNGPAKVELFKPC